MLSIPSKLTLQMDLPTFMTNNVLDKIIKPQLQHNKKANIKSFQNRKVDPGPLETQSDALPLHHLENYTKRLNSR